MLRVGELASIASFDVGLKRRNNLLYQIFMKACRDYMESTTRTWDNATKPDIRREADRHGLSLAQYFIYLDSRYRR